MREWSDRVRVNEPPLTETVAPMPKMENAGNALSNVEKHVKNHHSRDVELVLRHLRRCMADRDDAKAKECREALLHTLLEEKIPGYQRADYDLTSETCPTDFSHPQLFQEVLTQMQRLAEKVKQDVRYECRYGSWQR